VTKILYSFYETCATDILVSRFNGTSYIKKFIAHIIKIREKFNILIFGRFLQYSAMLFQDQFIDKIQGNKTQDLQRF